MVNTLLPGEPAPWFHAKALSGNPRYAFDAAAGRPILMLFHGSFAWPASAPALELVTAHRDLFDDDKACFFGVSIDPGDVSAGRIEQMLPGIRWFLDDDRHVSSSYGAVEGEGEGARYRPHWLLLDPSLRVVAPFPIDKGQEAIAALRAFIARTDEPATAPVLIVPRVFEPALCRALIAAYERDGGHASGFMREVDGVTVERTD
ncbi:MAG: redoxin protein, partial [Sphingomonas bacterium]